MEALVRSYEKKNVFFIHTLGGDEELPVLHFKKHYRLNYPVIPDNLDRYRHLIRVTGITNVAVFGGNGVCVLNESFMDGGSGSGFQKAIDAALAKLDGPNRREAAFVDGGTVYAPPVKDEGPIVRQRTPFLAAGPAGEVHLVYSSEEGGTGRARDYSPAIAVAQDGVPCVAWDNSHKSSLGYNAKALFVNRLAGKDFAEQVEAAASRGAVDSPRLLTDSKGGLHLLWNQESGGAWEVWIRPFGSKGMGEPRKLDLKAKNPRYPAGCFDTSGKLWVAYTDVVRPKWEVRAEPVEG